MLKKGNKQRRIVDIIIGSVEKSTLENRGFSAIVFAAFCIALLSVIGDTIQQLGIIQILYSFFMMCCFGTMYYIARKKGVYKPLIFPFYLLGLITTLFIWYFLGGITGATLVFAMSFIGILPLVVNGNKRYYIFIFFVLLALALVIFEIQNPGFVQEYENYNSKIIDKFFSVTYISLGVFLLMGLIVHSYRLEQKKNDLLLKQLKESNQELENLNTELQSTLTHLKNTQEQLIHSEKMAALGVLTAGIAHEINNPLNYIMGGYFGLNQEIKELNLDTNELIKKRLKDIETGVLRATNIVKGLNQLSRDNVELDEECDIHAILENCLSILRGNFVHKIDVVNNYAAEKYIVKGNSGKLHQVIVNIITNAVDAIAEKGTLKIDTSNSKDHVNISIEDSGRGIPSEIIDKIMDPFYTTKEPGKGTGLGLSISNSIIQEHQGEITISSKPGKGTIVKIELPLIKL